MKSGLVKFLYSLLTLAALTLPNQLTAQNGDANTSKHLRYKLIEVGTFGGPNSYFTFISKPLNSHGVATGSADTALLLSPPFCLLSPDCFVAHAFVWKGGIMTDLSALPGIGASFPNDINGKGVVVGISLNGGSDPVIGVPFFDAVVFKEDQIIDLGTFGGPLSYAAAINDENQVVGFALNDTPDSFDLGDSCENFPMPTQMRAFIWQDGVKKNLGTLGTVVATGINSKEQIVGASTDCFNPLHAFLWEHGQIVDLNVFVPPSSTLTLTQATVINDRGEISVQGVLPNGNQRGVLLIPCDSDHPNAEGCDYSLVEADSANQVQPAQLTSMQPKLASPNENRLSIGWQNRLRGLRPSRNSRFGLARGRTDSPTQ